MPCECSCTLRVFFVVRIMEDPPESICREIKTYLEKKKTSPKTPYADPQGWLSKSRECGCSLCYVACQCVEGVSEVEKNKQANTAAVAQNSALGFSQRLDSRKEDDDFMTAGFKTSGLNFAKGKRYAAHKPEQSVEVFVVHADDDPVIPVAAQISGNTGSDQSFRVALQWLETCVKEHRMLCPILKQTKLPLRVIDVLVPGSNDVRLVETEGELGLYACLSHCWGEIQPLRTTSMPKGTLMDYKQRIRWDDLPKTFQDAITVTRKVGVQYIWIDSLCIIQDDAKDWQIQSALMAEIYQNAVVTIAGSASSGAYQGLFREADPVHIDRPFSGDPVPNILEKVRTRKALPHSAAELPLMKRGWVFQERLLSSRYLHFGPNELIWECMERLVCECGTLSFEAAYSSRWLGPKGRMNPVSLSVLKDVPNGVSDTWQAAVADYSGMKLSYPEDIFPAISGIAHRIQEATGWAYVAGMWKETLITDLVWITAMPKTTARCEKWRAPTFSWASVIHGDDMRNRTCIDYGYMRNLGRGLDATHNEFRTTLHAAVVNVHSEAVGSDATGQLKSASITLQGTLIRARLDFEASEGPRWRVRPTRKTVGSRSVGSLKPDFNFNSVGSGIAPGVTIFCLKLIGYSKLVETGYGESLYYIVLREVESTRPLISSDYQKDSIVFERVALLQDSHGPDAERLEEVSEAEAIQHNVLLRII
ncbi:heterokaryon incompatibility protein-domain-containing protein [Paraphoma chrysanthemicola]|nr:heterokaryon incompatibility protein-domain-containing protein [Paraphoma chrysanthemicola]